MKSPWMRCNRSFLAGVAVFALSISPSICSAGETLLSSFEGNLSTTLGIDWQNDALGGTFVTTGVSHGSQALQLNHLRTQSIPLKLFGPLETLYETFLENTQLRAEFTLPATANYREAFYRLQVNGGSTTIDGDDIILTPGQTVTGIWDYAAAGVIATLESLETVATFSLQLGLRGPDFDSTTSFTTIDNIRWFSPTTVLHGDYNDDGFIDAADYTVWRNAIGSPSAELFNDFTPESVDDDDYDYWKAHYGETLPPGSGGVGYVVPEPASVLLVLTFLAWLPQRSRCR